LSIRISAKIICPSFTMLIFLINVLSVIVGFLSVSGRRYSFYR